MPTSSWLHITSFVWATPHGLLAAISSAMASAVSRRASSSTTVDTRPSSSALAASMMRPVSISSQARDAPIRRGSSQLTPMSQPDRPMRTKATLNLALRGRDADVAAEGEGEPAAGGRAVHRGDHRLREAPQPRDQRGDVLLRRHAGLHPTQALAARWGAVAGEVEPGAEPAAGAGEDDRSARPVAAGVVQRLVELLDELRGHRVQAVGTVEGQQADAVARWSIVMQAMAGAWHAGDRRRSDLDDRGRRPLLS